MPRPVRVAVLVSGGGSNLEAILDAQGQGALGCAQVSLVLSSKPGAYALVRAANRGIPTRVVDPKAFATDDACQAAILDSLTSAKVEVVCLAGYMRKLGRSIIREFQGRILNIHPALLPKHGGPGMYGHHVHEAVLASGDTESGCTVHLVDEEYDHGAILAQIRVPVMPGDTAHTLASRVLEQEHRLYPKVLREFCETMASGVKS